MEKKLLEIWSKPYMSELPNQIKNRGFNFAQNKNQREILITGINPSFRIGEDEGNCFFDFDFIAKETKYDSYWTSLKRMLRNENINLLNRTAYLDIFYFREKEQKFLTKEILPSPSGLTFIADQLNLTQNIIENIIKPKLIIVKNKESSAYWGKLADKEIIWMGYNMEFEQETQFGDLYKIKGLINSPQRVSPEIIVTNLQNARILFTAHINQYTPKTKRPTPEFVSSLLLD